MSELYRQVGNQNRVVRLIIDVGRPLLSTATSVVNQTSQPLPEIVRRHNRADRNDLRKSSSASTVGILALVY